MLMARMKDPQDWQAPFWGSMPLRNESLGIFSFPPEYIETLQAPGLVGWGHLAGSRGVLVGLLGPVSFYTCFCDVESRESGS